MLASLANACSATDRPALYPPYQSTARLAPAAGARDVDATSNRAPAANPRGLVKSGTGFFVSQDGLLLTSAHVVSGCATISVWPSDNRAYRISVVAVDRRRDLALLATGVAAPQFAAAPRRWRPWAGERVAVLGFGVYADRPLEPVLMRGGVAGDATAPGGKRAFVIHAKVFQGTSGGLVLDEHGSLVGMVVGYYADRRNLAVVVSNIAIADFLAAQGVRLSPPQTQGGPPPPVDRLLLGASALVQCTPMRDGNRH